VEFQLEKAQTITYDTQTWLGRGMTCRHPVIAVREGLTEHQGTNCSLLIKNQDQW